MTVRRPRPKPSLSVKTAELALAVPQVVAHRLLRMAQAGPRMSARDRKEFARMFAEKNSAFGESWNAMAQQALQSHRAFATTLALAAFKPPSARAGAAHHALAAQLQQAALAVLGKGLAPVHRRAVANAKRLARTRLR
ncbi:MAG: polyhydroxyalkanoate granule-associated phasin [Caldimonas sp.]